MFLQFYSRDKEEKDATCVSLLVLFIIIISRVLTCNYSFHFWNVFLMQTSIWTFYTTIYVCCVCKHDDFREIGPLVILHTEISIYLQTKVVKLGNRIYSVTCSKFMFKIRVIGRFSEYSSTRLNPVHLRFSNTRPSWPIFRTHTKGLIRFSKFELHTY